jgi:hypothetical protein
MNAGHSLSSGVRHPHRSRSFRTRLTRTFLFSFFLFLPAQWHLLVMTPVARDLPSRPFVISSVVRTLMF